MAIEKYQEEMDGLIDSILDGKEKVKMYQENVDSDKQILTELLNKNNLTEYTGKNGKVNFVSFEREGLVKDNVVKTVDGVNKGEVKQINMKDLTKDIEVNFINVRGFFND